MDLERLKATAKDVDDTTRRSNEVKAKATENNERYTAMLREVRHFIRAVNGANPDKQYVDRGTGYFVIEKGVELPELGKGYMAARIEGLGTDFLDDTSNFIIKFDLKPNLDHPRSPGKRVTAEYFAANNPNLPPEVPYLPHVNKVDYRDRAGVEENTAKLDVMLANVAETLQLLIGAAMNPDLNPQIAEQVQNYYETLGQTAPTQTATA